MCICVNTMQHTATHCNNLHPLHTRYPSSSSVLQCVSVCCSVLPCVAVCCSVLQCVAVCCTCLPIHTSPPSHTVYFSTMYNPCIAIERECARARMCARAFARAQEQSSIWQARLPNILQHTGKHCNTLHRLLAT